MKKSFVLLLVVLLLTGSLFAQGEVETADAEPTKLVVWAAAAEAEGVALVEKFNELYPEIDVDLIRAGSNELKTRLNAEQPNPSGDVLIGIAKETFDEFYDYFEPYKAVNHDSITETVRDKAEVPKYYGYSMPLQCFIVNSEVFPEGKGPQSWEDLADPQYKGQIILANPALSGSAYAQLYMMYTLYGEDFLRKVAQNAVFVSSSTAVPQSVARGEYGIGATGEGNVAKYIEQGYPVTYLYPEEGTGARFDASGIIKGCENLKAAQLFMDFMTSEEAYKIINQEFNRRVVLEKMPGPKYLPALDEINLFDYDAVEAAELRTGLSDKFTDMMV